MSDTEYALIRKTWAMAMIDSDQTARVFYSNLFKLDPSAEALFKSDMNAQGEKLMATLNFVVDHLDEPDDLLPAARELAIRHVAYGVTADQYSSVGGALITTLKELLGAEFSSEAEAQWGQTYQGLAEHMISSAY